MNSRHLAHDELLLALVDAADLATDQRAHLAACPRCRDAQTHLEENFLRLGRLARRHTPAPARPFRLTAAAPRRGFRPAWAVGLAAALLLAVLIGRFHGLSSQPPPVPTAAALEADRQLTEAVDALVEDALPVNYQQLVSLDREKDPAEPEIDDDLLDWVVPPIDQDDLT